MNDESLVDDLLATFMPVILIIGHVYLHMCWLGDWMQLEGFAFLLFCSKGKAKSVSYLCCQHITVSEVLCSNDFYALRSGYYMCNSNSLVIFRQHGKVICYYL